MSIEFNPASAIRVLSGGKTLEDLNKARSIGQFAVDALPWECVDTATNVVTHHDDNGKEAAVYRFLSLEEMVTRYE